MDRRRFGMFVAALSPLLLSREARAAARGSSDAEAAVALVSQIRARHGLGPVAIDPRMNAAARYQASAVARLGALSHGDFSGRIHRFGLHGTMGENLAYGSKDVAGAVAQWQGSPPHLSNLLMPGATRMGIGRAERGKTRYWAMIIGQPKG